MRDLERLGPWPEKSIATLSDLGLTEVEVARYFHVDPTLIHRLRKDAASLARQMNWKRSATHPSGARGPQA